MYRKVRVLDASIPEIIGEIAEVIADENEGTYLLGFPKDSGLGWEDSSIPNYSCWYTLKENVEFIGTVTNSKFK